MTTLIKLSPLIVIALVIAALATGVVAQPATDGGASDAGQFGGAGDGTDDWSPVVYPLQRLPLTFSHKKHMARGMACVACHAAGTTSRSAVDNLLPTEAECRACHAIDRGDPAKVATPTAACGACHPGWAPGKVVEQTYMTPPPLKFDHAQHTKTACESCHPRSRDVDLATTQQLPTMQSCFTCHKDGQDERRCGDCHLARLGGLLQTEFAHGSLVPGRDGLGDAHGPGFKSDHKTEARQPGASCTACHDRSECVECHTGSVKPMDFHPGDYVMTHAIDARRGKPECSACHRLESFCVACHERSGIGDNIVSHYSAKDPSRFFHPSGWASSTPGAPNLHAQEARRNVNACVSCHREEDCMTCHSAQNGAGHISPHPSNWRGSAQCKSMDRANRRMCLRCHVTQDQLGCDW